jgi:hypothetical protein
MDGETALSALEEVEDGEHHDEEEVGGEQEDGEEVDDLC